MNTICSGVLNFKKLDIGTCFSKPIFNPFDNSQYKTPVKANLLDG